jgi:hypothetical protein
MPKTATQAKIFALISGAAISAFVGWPAQGADSAHPDFAGFWGRNSFDPEAPDSGPGPLQNIKRLPNGTGDPQALVGDYHSPILRPEAAAIVKKQGDVSLSGDAFADPSNRCGAYSPPFTFAMQLGFQMLEAKDHITILYNQDDQVRRVRMNAKHPARVTPSAMGDSVGQWDGDTLVIDTVGVKLGPLTMADRYGAPVSKDLHVIERYRLVDAAEAKAGAEKHEKANGRLGGGPGAMPVDTSYGKGLELKFTIDDPTYYTTPWSAQVHYLHTKLDWQEQVCAENFYEPYHGRYADIPAAPKPDF